MWVSHSGIENLAKQFSGLTVLKFPCDFMYCFIVHRYESFC